jgi:DNA primase
LVLDKFRGRIIFPLLDHRGNVAGFSGRIMPTAGKELAKYINSPETPVYHKSNLLYGLNLAKPFIKESKEAIFVEGELDMISSWQVGVKNIVAIKGSALTDEQVRLISRLTKKIILALDSDFAGDLAARRGIAVAQKQGLEIHVARLGEYKDPDEAAKKNPGEYKKFLKETVGVWDFILDSVFSKFDIKSGLGKAKISSEIIPVINSIPDKIVQAHYVAIVARRLGVPESAVNEQLTQIGQESKQEDEAKVVVPITKKIDKPRRQLLEERLLTMAFQGNPTILLEQKVFKLIETPLTKRICEEYYKFSENHKEFSPSEFTEGLPKELVNGFAELVLADTEEY